MNPQAEYKQVNNQNNAWGRLGGAESPPNTQHSHLNTKIRQLICITFSHVHINLAQVYRQILDTLVYECHRKKHMRRTDTRCTDVPADTRHTHWCTRGHETHTDVAAGTRRTRVYPRTRDTTHWCSRINTLKNVTLHNQIDTDVSGKFISLIQAKRQEA